MFVYNRPNKFQKKVNIIILLGLKSETYELFEI